MSSRPTTDDPSKSPADEPSGKGSAPELTLRQRVVRGFLVSIGGMGAWQFMRLVSNLILSRLLFPEAFGVMVLVSSVLFGLEMLSDLGFGPAIVRHERGEDQRFLDTAWTLAIIRGVILWGLACAASPFMASFYDEPLLKLVLPVASFSACINSFASTKFFSARRRLELGRLAIMQVAGQLVALTIMVPWAYMAPSVWPLVGGALISSVTRTTLSHVLLKGAMNRMRFNRDDALALWQFGRWIIAGSALQFVSKQGDRLLIGKLAGLATLGVYGIAGQLTTALGRVGFKLSREVLFPALSAVARERPSHVRNAFYKARLRLDLTIMGGHGILSAVSILLVQVLYDERYAEGGWMMGILCVRGALGYYADTCQSCLIALKRLKYQVTPVAVRTVGVLIGLPLGWHFWGIPGLIWASVICEVPPMLVLWHGLATENIWRFSREMLGLGFFAVAFVVTHGLLLLLPY